MLNPTCTPQVGRENFERMERGEGGGGEGGAPRARFGDRPIGEARDDRRG